VTVLRSRTVVLPDGERPATVTIHCGRIVVIGATATRAAAGGGVCHVTAEMCPHYLTFGAEEIPDGATGYKCCPRCRQPRGTVARPRRRDDRRGRLRPLARPFGIEPSRSRHRNPVTLYVGRILYGVVKATWLGGEPVNFDGPPRGRLLSRGDA
jgi:hypothetical protein